MNNKLRYVLKYITPAFLIIMTTYVLVQVAVTSLYEENEHKLSTLAAVLEQKINKNPDTLAAIRRGDRTAVERELQPELDDLTISDHQNWNQVGGSVYLIEKRMLAAFAPRSALNMSYDEAFDLPAEVQQAIDAKRGVYRTLEPGRRLQANHAYVHPLLVDGKVVAVLSFTQSTDSISVQTRKLWTTGVIICLLSLLVLTALGLNEYRRSIRFNREVADLIHWLQSYDSPDHNPQPPKTQSELLKELPAHFHKVISLLQNVRRHKREVLNRLPMSIVTFNADRQINYINPHFMKLIGYTREEMQAWKPEDWKRHYRLLNGGRLDEALLNGKSVDNELGTLISRSGQEIPVTVTVRILNSDQGLPLGYLVFANDLSNEFELDLLTQKTHYIFNSIPLSVLLLDSGSRIDYVNPAVCRLLGKTENDLIGKQIDDVLPWEADAPSPNLIEHTQRVIATGMRARLADVRRNVQEREFDLEFDLFPLLNPYTTEADGCMVLIHDKTVYREWEELSQRVDADSNYVQMAATIAHEVRNPMTSVRGFLQLLAKQIEGDQQKMYLDVMQTEIDRMNAILSEYLSMARAPKVDWERIELSDLVRETFLLLEGEANYRGVSLQLDLEDHCSINGMSRELKQVLINLVRNAFDATEGKQGHVSIELVRDGDMHHLEVTDNGCGISADQISRIFDPFFTTKAMGTGLGLPVCKKIIESHGGALRCRSTLGTGTTFTIELPHAEA